MNIDKFKQIIGLIIKKERERQGLTQDALSEIISLDATNLSYIENGRRAPSFPTLCKIITHLKFEPNELFSFLPFKETDKNMLDIEIYQALKPLSDETKQSILDLVKKLSK